MSENKNSVCKDLTVEERVKLQNAVQHFNIGKHGLDAEEESPLCEWCGEAKAIVEFFIVFTDGESAEVCSKCVAEYFQEIPDEIESVERFKGGKEKK